MEVNRKDREINLEQAPWSLLLGPEQALGVLNLQNSPTARRLPRRACTFSQPSAPFAFYFFSVFDMLALRATCTSLRNNQTTVEFLKQLLAAAFGRPVQDVDLFPYTEKKFSPPSNWHYLLVEEVYKQQFLRILLSYLQTRGCTVGGSFALHHHLSSGKLVKACDQCNQSMKTHLLRCNRYLPEGKKAHQYCEECWQPNDVDIFCPDDEYDAVLAALDHYKNLSSLLSAFDVVRSDTPCDYETQARLHYESVVLPGTPEITVTHRMVATHPLALEEGLSFSSHVLSKLATLRANHPGGRPTLDPETQKHQWEAQGLQVADVMAAPGMEAWYGQHGMDLLPDDDLRMVDRLHHLGWFDGRRLGTPRPFSIEHTARFKLLSRRFTDEDINSNEFRVSMGPLHDRTLELNVIRMNTSLTPLEVLNGFDLEVCRVGLHLPSYTTKFQLLYGHGAKEAIADRRLSQTQYSFGTARLAFQGTPLVLQGGGCVARFLDRVQRYEERGFRLADMRERN